MNSAGCHRDYQGALATFQRLMERTVGNMNLIEVLVYLGDIIVFGRTLEEHGAWLEKVFERLHEEGLKLLLEKCQCYRTSVTYLGYVVSAGGVTTDPKKLEAVSTWPRPSTLPELRSFLVFCSYYRRFVANFPKIARPLNELLQVVLGKVENKPSVKESGARRKGESRKEQWTPQCKEAFWNLKRSLTEALVLVYSDPAKPYKLHVDASRDELGGVLYQEQDSGLRPGSLTPSERNYLSTSWSFWL